MIDFILIDKNSLFSFLSQKIRATFLPFFDKKQHL
jgi:alanyl-tRNA synthetase